MVVVSPFRHVVSLVALAPAMHECAYAYVCVCVLRGRMCGANEVFAVDLMQLHGQLAFLHLFCHTFPHATFVLLI